MRLAVTPRDSTRLHVAALLWLTFLAAIVGLPAVGGWRSLGPDSILDWDPLYRTGPAPARPTTSDYSPINQHYPRDLAFARGLHEGRFDLWNPLVSAGAPLWAEPGGPFFPLKLPFYLSPSPRTYAIYLALRLVLAGFGAYMLARARGLGHAAALAAGSSFELSGGSIAWLPHGVGSPLYVLPWVILGAFAIARAPGRRTVAGAAVALGLAAHGGHPTLIVMVFTAFAVAVAAHIAAAWRTPRAALAIAVAALCSVVLALLLAAVVLLPLGELVQYGISYKDRLAGALMWRWQLIESRMTLPIALFAPGTLQVLHPQFQTMFGFAPAIGKLALVLAIIGILHRALDLALIAVAILGIGLACAPPGLAWIHDIPGLRLILPTYAWPLVTLALTQAAGSGVAALCESRGRRSTALYVILVIIGATSLFLVRDVAHGPKPFAEPLRQAIAGGAGMIRLAWPMLFAVAALAISSVLQKTNRLRLGAHLLIASIALELLVEVVPMTWHSPQRALDAAPSPAVQFLGGRLADGESRMIALPYMVGQPMTPMLFDLADFRGSAPLPIARYHEYLKTIDPKAAQFVYQDVPVVRSPLLNVAGVRWLVFARAGLEDEPRDLDAVLVFPPQRPSAAANPELRPAYIDDRVVVFENQRASTRARVVHDFVGASDRSAARHWLEEWARRDDGAERDLVVLEPDENGKPLVDFTSVRDIDASETVRIVAAGDPDRLELEARLAREGLVVVADTLYPGWKATIDGKPAPIFPADLMFRAVRVGAGTHRIDFEYRPRSFRYGLALLALGVAAVAVLLRPRPV
jgi:hypothetical protein